VVLTPEGTVLEDLGSKNGTRVNGTIVRGSVTLADGDEVEAGVLRLVFRTRLYGSTETANPRSAARKSRF
jgi:pSer/pThr/pTyr-binding forkhead associated (FHA) protein